MWFVLVCLCVCDFICHEIGRNQTTSSEIGGGGRKTEKVRRREKKREGERVRKRVKEKEGETLLCDWSMEFKKIQNFCLLTFLRVMLCGVISD